MHYIYHYQESYLRVTIAGEQEEYKIKIAIPVIRNSDDPPEPEEKIDKTEPDDPQ
jgi:hypothetical protein